MRWSFRNIMIATSAAAAAVGLTVSLVAVLGAMQPALNQSASFVAAVCVLFGLFNGVFLGRLARYLGAWQRQDGAVVAA